MLGTSIAAAAQPATTPRGKAWWADITALASDATEGRQPGTPGYDMAAAYVVKRFKALGLAPAGDGGGYLQQVAFEEQSIDHGASTAALVAADGTRTPISVGADLLISPGGAARPESVAAPLVFIGYGLKLPGHDDFAGVDLKGKIAVVISGGPADVSGPVKSANRSDRVTFLQQAGAVGLISLTTPAQVEIPWVRQKLLASQSGMYFADAALRDTPDGFFTARFDPAQSEALFAGSGRSFAELAALADASAPVPGLALPRRLEATVAKRLRSLTSPNLVARLTGSDPRLRAEHVVLSAHLDHVGVGEPIAGDRIYNGAMDDASGVASVLDIAARLKAGKRPRRSILFVIVTAEEKGLLGSHYFARRPTVPAASLVANLNFDMPLPLWPLKLVLVQGDGESTLGAVARAAAAKQGLALTPDPLPERNSFTRTDQFSFVKAGIPALAFKFGFIWDSPEFRIERDWRANRYHSPSDDLDQPGVLKDEIIRLDDLVAAIARDVADAPARPAWLPTSVFRPQLRVARDEAYTGQVAQ
ncbi:MAG: peptidase M28 [Alphaproteobacteria bacterium]|nr:MAG: peptidase M28 [Alphaproteobacteria bacterium]